MSAWLPAIRIPYRENSTMRTTLSRSIGRKARQEKCTKTRQKSDRVEQSKCARKNRAVLSAMTTAATISLSTKVAAAEAGKQ